MIEKITHFKNLITSFFLLFPIVINGAIIADHNAVKQFDSIPAEYIDKVKLMLLYIVGESHSTSYGVGLGLLAAQSNKHPGIGAMLEDIQYAGDLNPSYPTLDPQNPRLRMIRGYGGEGTWFAHVDARQNVLTMIERYNSQGVSAIGFGWCWDMLWAPYAPNRTADIDPVYRCRWYGRSQDGPQGDRAWGLDAGDQTITGNSVNMDTYLTLTQAYIDTCIARNYKIKPFFTTGPVDPSMGAYDNPKEQGYQRELKHTKIREWVNAHPNTILFDFADILSHNNSGQLATDTWTDDQNVTHTFPTFHNDNGVLPYGQYHFGETGAIRVAKAVWWMMARISGWDGVPTGIVDSIASISISPASISLNSDTLQTQLSLIGTLTNTTTQNITNSATWSCSDTAIAKINATGLITAVFGGSAQVTAHYRGFTAQASVTVASSVGRIDSIASVSISPASISLNSDTLQTQLSLIGTLTNSTTQNVTNSATWSCSDTAIAKVNATGLITAVLGGSAQVTAHYRSFTAQASVTVASSVGRIDSIASVSINPASISLNSDTLQTQLSLIGTLTNNTTQNITNSATWSCSDTAIAKVNATGLVTAVNSGSAQVTARYRNFTAHISVTVAASIVSSIKIFPETAIMSRGTTKQFTVAAQNQYNKDISIASDTITWQVIGSGTISTSGLYTADSGSKYANIIVSLNAEGKIFRDTAIVSLSLSCIDDFSSNTSLKNWTVIDRDEYASSSVSISDGRLQLVGAGNDMFQSNNQFYGVYRTDIIGDFDLSVQVYSFNGVDSYSKVGLIVANDFNNLSSGGFAAVNACPTLRFQFLHDTSGTVGQIDQSDFTEGSTRPSYPCWLRLKRDSTTISAYYRNSLSDNWTQIGKAISPTGIQTNSQVGLFVCAHSAQPVTATFDNFGSESQLIIVDNRETVSSRKTTPYSLIRCMGTTQFNWLGNGSAVVQVIDVSGKLVNSYSGVSSGSSVALKTEISGLYILRILFNENSQKKSLLLRPLLLK
jgi:regulation of enolase protein 1 (concanavalin A-like superfamily)